MMTVPHIYFIEYTALTTTVQRHTIQKALSFSNYRPSCKGTESRSL